MSRVKVEGRKRAREEDSEGVGAGSAGTSSALVLAATTPSNAPASNAFRDRNADAPTPDDENNDDELQVVAVHGALVDFPHARENCALHAFFPSGSARNLVCCTNCYCYICDVPASACASWQPHSNATHRDLNWRVLRECTKSGRPLPPFFRMPGVAHGAPHQPPRPAAPPQPPAPPAPSAAEQRDQRLSQFSCESVLKAVQRVHPVEARAPAGITATLRHYQRQSLAFMRAMEAGEDSTMPRPQHTSYRHAPLGAAGGAAPVDALRAGGWLADAVGMGKTLVCACLVAADAAASPAAAPAAAPAPAPAAPPSTEVPTTVIFVPVSLLGQWADELAKHAPQLRVVTLDNKGKFTPRAIAALAAGEYDVVLTTRSTMSWTELGRAGQPFARDARHFRRVIYDESHLLPGVKTQQFVNVQATRSTYRWAVTGTPCTSSVKELEAQAEFVGHWRGGLMLASACTRFEFNKAAASLRELTDALQRLMIRHTKEQQISGGAALALPDQSFKTHALDMSAGERAEYAAASAREDGRLAELKRTGAKGFVLQQALRTRLQVCAHVARALGADAGAQPRSAEACTKFAALRDALRERRRRDPKMHAVVFTQHNVAHALITSMLRRDGFTVLAFTGSSNAGHRSASIRTFQSALERRADAPAAAEGAPAASEGAGEEEADDDDGSDGCKIFVITLKSGAVGITLTAADAVYLMEPCLDPSAEVQAAGRIHRLGQNKQVTVHRFVYRNTVEESVRDLHDKIKAGEITVADNFFTPSAVKLLASK